MQNKMTISLTIIVTLKTAVFQFIIARKKNTGNININKAVLK